MASDKALYCAGRFSVSVATPVSSLRCTRAWCSISVALLLIMRVLRGTIVAIRPANVANQSLLFCAPGANSHRQWSSHEKTCCQRRAHPACIGARAAVPDWPARGNPVLSGSRQPVGSARPADRGRGLSAWLVQLACQDTRRAHGYGDDGDGASHHPWPVSRVWLGGDRVAAADR